LYKNENNICCRNLETLGSLSIRDHKVSGGKEPAAE